MTYAEKLRDPRWIEKRFAIFKRDDYKCRDCGSEEDLQVHHCYYRGNPWDVEDDLLLTLCETCHATRQDFEDALRLEIGRLSSRLKASDVDRFRVRFKRLAFEFERNISALIEKIYEEKP